MTKRLSALAEHYQAGHFGLADTTGIVLSLIPDLSLQQVAAWADTLDAVQQQLGIENPQYGVAIGDAEQAMFHINPLTWWLIGHAPIVLDASHGATLDLSHSRTRIRIAGANASELLNRLLPIDLRESVFTQNSVAATQLHHVGVVVWRNNLAYDLLLPRGYAVSLWEVILQTALQFGVEVTSLTSEL